MAKGSTDTTLRDINELVTRGVLRKSGAGGGKAYLPHAGGESKAQFPLHDDLAIASATIA